jgi:hypothetical protein
VKGGLEMAKGINVRVFTIEEAQQRKKIKSTDINQSRVDEYVKVETEHHEEGISNEMYKLLHTNPFLYVAKRAEFKISSIEEFYIPVKKETMPFGTLIRGQAFRKSKKRRIIKKAFKNWKLEFITNKERILDFEDDKMQIANAFGTSNIKFKHFCFLLLTFFIVSFLKFKPGTMWTSLANKAWFMKISSGIDNAFKISWFSSLTYITLLLVICALIYRVLHNEIVNEFKRMNKDRQTVYRSSNLIIEKEFKKKFRITKKYYLSNIRKETYVFPPLSLDKTAPEKVDLQEIAEMTESFVKKTNEFKKQKNIMKLIRYITIYGAYLGGIFIFGYVVYLVIRNFI